MNIAIIGATGAVGREIIKCLDRLKFPVDQLFLVASDRSVGQVLETPFGKITLESLNEAVFSKADIAIFSAEKEISLEYAPLAKKHNCLMIDNSSAFRYDDNVPMIIPEINADLAITHQGIIANPNCTTAIAAVVLWPLHQAFGLKKVIISTYQAASGAGQKAMDELTNQTKDYLAGKPETVKYFQYPLAFNIIPHIDEFQENGYTREEMKVVWEMRKIFRDSDLAISCTAVRIPVLRVHSESITIETEKMINPELARKILIQAPGVILVDEPQKNLYPMPRDLANHDDVAVGRIRQNLIFGDHGLDLFIAGDQLLKGAALNAVQIAKLFSK